MGVVSLSGILLGGDSRGESLSDDFNVNYLVEDNGNANKEKNFDRDFQVKERMTDAQRLLQRLKRTMQKFTPKQLASVSGFDISAGVLAMSSRNREGVNEDIAGAPHFRPQVKVTHGNNWNLTLRLNPEVTSRGLDISSVNAKLHFVW